MIEQRKKQTLSRKSFLKTVGAGTVGAALLGAPAALSGCKKKPTVDTERRPNVLLIIIDTLRKDHVGVYGNDCIKTPNLDALAEESLLFTQSHPDAMATIPARRAIHTGMRTWPTRPPFYGWRPIPSGQGTLAEMLKGHGYRTALATDNWHLWLPPKMNFDRGFEVVRTIRGQTADHDKEPFSGRDDEMDDYLNPGGRNYIRQYLANVQGRESEEDWFAPKVFSAAMDVLKEASGENRPFFLVADCYDPHEPWDPPEEYVALYDEGYKGKEPIWPLYGKDYYLTDRQLLRMRALYAAEITMMDRWLGKFLDIAHELKVMQNTMLVIVSDHGHLLGEHGYTGKLDYALYPELTDTVLMVRHPQGVGAGKSTDFFASTHDVAPTILGFLGVEPPVPMDGQDLTPIMEGKEPKRPRDHFTQGYKDHVCCRDEHRVMFCLSDGTHAHLYDAVNDVGQTRDLAQAEPETVRRMYEEYAQKDAAGRLPNF
jgi:arylsulfatase A-like enzyme